MAFQFAYKLSGSAPTMITLPVKASAVISAGELVNIESGTADGAATTDAALCGIALHDADNTGGSAGDISVRVIIDPDAVYAIEDANARLAGATLDIASGGLGVTTSSNADLVVVAPSSATERTLVKIVSTQHYLTVNLTVN